ncbi:hypothetical protein TRFO_05795 [Tritrichomonas foetus]|uniref:Ubiquitin-like domain-containing protein n=1 Tax=Tritrichomonas foetus TaxID=1144522 RepID=A0A1J4K4A2_9EUKA|nr:hypothetical protein TRFO_05795 [Tritrichomonas foetus]|eukprot:OHT05672.1 hypothetical protein TRFO_05795 [Tritrichomonas foetus]
MKDFPLVDPCTGKRYSIPIEIATVQGMYAYVGQLFNLKYESPGAEFFLCYRHFIFFYGIKNRSITELGYDGQHEFQIQKLRKYNINIRMKLNPNGDGFPTGPKTCHQFTSVFDLKKQVAKNKNINPHNLILYHDNIEQVHEDRKIADIIAQGSNSLILAVKKGAAIFNVKMKDDPTNRSFFAEMKDYETVQNLKEYLSLMCFKLENEVQFTENMDDNTELAYVGTRRIDISRCGETFKSQCITLSVKVLNFGRFTEKVCRHLTEYQLCRKIAYKYNLDPSIIYISVHSQSVDSQIVEANLLPSQSHVNLILNNSHSKEYCIGEYQKINSLLGSIGQLIKYRFNAGFYADGKFLTIESPNSLIKEEIKNIFMYYNQNDPLWTILVKDKLRIVPSSSTFYECIRQIYNVSPGYIKSIYLEKLNPKMEVQIPKTFESLIKNPPKNPQQMTFCDSKVEIIGSRRINEIGNPNIWKIQFNSYDNISVPVTRKHNKTGLSKKVHQIFRNSQIRDLSKLYKSKKLVTKTLFFKDQECSFYQSFNEFDFSDENPFEVKAAPKMFSVDDFYFVENNDFNELSPDMKQKIQKKTNVRDMLHSLDPEFVLFSDFIQLKPDDNPLYCRPAKTDAYILAKLPPMKTIYINNCHGIVIPFLLTQSLFSSIGAVVLGIFKLTMKDVVFRFEDTCREFDLPWCFNAGALPDKATVKFIYEEKDTSQQVFAFDSDKYIPLALEKANDSISANKEYIVRRIKGLENYPMNDIKFMVSTFTLDESKSFISYNIPDRTPINIVIKPESPSNYSIDLHQNFENEGDKMLSAEEIEKLHLEMTADVINNDNNMFDEYNNMENHHNNNQNAENQDFDHQELGIPGNDDFGTPQGFYSQNFESKDFFNQKWETTETSNDLINQGMNPDMNQYVNNDHNNPLSMDTPDMTVANENSNDEFVYNFQVEEEMFKLTLPSEATIKDAKVKISQEKGYEPTTIIIMFGGKTLHDSILLKTLDLDDGDILQLFIKDMEELLLATCVGLKMNYNEYNGSGDSEYETDSD